jgi:glycolate oxidase FAD binding subunit
MMEPRRGETEKGRLGERGTDLGETLRPGDAEQIAQILLKASAEKCAVIPLGGGTMMDLGPPPSRVDLVVSLENLDGVMDHQPANLTVRAQAGITLGALNEALARHGQYLPLDPPFRDRATIGGILATNASGSLRVRFGSARDLVLGVRVALVDGQIVHGGGDVVKNVAGYDLPKLFIGSLGTLGIIVEATFKIAPLPSKTGTALAGFSDLEGASQLALRVLASPLLPFGVEILNPDASGQAGLEPIPSCVVRFGGLASAVAQQLREVEGLSHDCGAVSFAVREPDVEFWTRLPDLIYEKPTVVKIGVLPTQIIETAAQAQKLAVSNGLGCSILAHAVGILLVALDGDSAHLEVAIVALRDAVAARRGHLVVQRAPRELRERIDVWGATPTAFDTMKKLKLELDPNGILNPGRFIRGL